MFQDLDVFLKFLTMENMVVPFLEKARYCAMIPRDCVDPIDVYKECVKQVEFIEWLKNDPRVHSVVKEYASNIQYEKDFNLYLPPIITKLNPCDLEISSYIEEAENDGISYDYVTDCEYGRVKEAILKFLETDPLIMSLKPDPKNHGNFNVSSTCYSDLAEDYKSFDSVYEYFQGLKDFFYEVGRGDTEELKFEITLSNPMLTHPIKIQTKLDVFFDDREEITYSGYTVRELVLNINYHIDSKEIDEIQSIIGALIQKL